MQVVAVVGYSDRRLTLPPEARDFAGENLVTRALVDLFWECASKSPIARPGLTRSWKGSARAGDAAAGRNRTRGDDADAAPARGGPTHRETRELEARGSARSRNRRGTAKGRRAAAGVGGSRERRGSPTRGPPRVEIEEITDQEDAPSKREAVAAEPTTTRPREYYLVQEDEEADDAVTHDVINTSFALRVKENRNALVTPIRKFFSCHDRSTGL